MKASVLTDFGKIEYLDVPEPEFGYDEALVKVAYSGVCGTDVHVSQGHHPAAAPPLIMGHEFSGTVEKVGKQNKKGLEPGQRVVVQPFYSCGVCELCITGRGQCMPGTEDFRCSQRRKFRRVCKRTRSAGPPSREGRRPEACITYRTAGRLLCTMFE